MTTLLPVPEAICNSADCPGSPQPNWDALSPDVRSFYQWLKRWYDQSKDLHPSTGYLAKVQKVTERRIYQRLAALCEAGFIRTVVKPGVRRHIIPLVELPPPQKRRSLQPSFQGSLQGSVSGVTPYRALTQGTQDAETTTANPDPVPAEPDPSVVAELVQHGVGKSVARKLVREAGVAAVRAQIEALPHRRFHDPAAFLVAAVRNAFTPPHALQQARERHQLLQKRQERAAAVRAEETRRQQEQADLTALWSGLPEAQRHQLQSRAEVQALGRFPASLAEKIRARGGPVWQSNVREALLELLRSAGQPPIPGSWSVDFLANQYFEWIETQDITPNNPGAHCLNFIQAHRRRNGEEV